MKVNGTHYRPIWQAADGAAVEIIDQTRLPHEFAVARLATMADAAHAIQAPESGDLEEMTLERLDRAAATAALHDGSIAILPHAAALSLYLNAL